MATLFAHLKHLDIVVALTLITASVGVVFALIAVLVGVVLTIAVSGRDSNK